MDGAQQHQLDCDLGEGNLTNDVDDLIRSHCSLAALFLRDEFIAHVFSPLPHGCTYVGVSGWRRRRYLILCAHREITLYL